MFQVVGSHDAQQSDDQLPEQRIFIHGKDDPPILYGQDVYRRVDTQGQLLLNILDPSNNFHSS